MDACICAFLRVAVACLAQLEAAQTKLEVAQVVGHAKLEVAEARLAVVHSHLAPSASGGGLNGGSNGWGGLTSMFDGIFTPQQKPRLGLLGPSNGEHLSA